MFLVSSYYKRQYLLKNITLKFYGMKFKSNISKDISSEENIYLSSCAIKVHYLYK